MLVNSFLELKVSYQSNTWTPIAKELTIREVLFEIKSAKHYLQVSRLRQLLREGNEDDYNIYKRTLPSVTFCGTFDGKRKKEFLKTYNFIIVIDIDHLAQDELSRVKQILQSDPYVFSFWESPSQKGLKGLVSLSYDFHIDGDHIDRAHKSAFHKLSEYFLNSYQVELDESGSDTTRLCFFSFDPDAVIKESVDLFGISEDDMIDGWDKNRPEDDKSIGAKSGEGSLSGAENESNPGNYETIQAIIAFLTERNLSITDSYEKWYRVAFAIANSFSCDIGEKYYLSLCKLDGPRYDETSSKNMLRYCYENSTGRITFNSIVYFANQKGYRTDFQKGGIAEETSA